MITNTDITIYNAVNTGKETLYIGTPVKNVSLRGSSGVSFSNNNAIDNDSFILRIPLPADSDKQYIASKSYKLLTSSEFFTLQKGDYVVRGIVDDNITAPSEIIKKYGDDVMRVTSVADNSTSISPYLSHIKVALK